MAESWSMRVISPREWGDPLPLVEGEGTFVPVVWPGVGAEARSLHHVRLGPGARTLPLRHGSEAVYYVTSGEGHVVQPGGGPQPLREGSMVHVEPGTAYQFASRPGMVLVGGPCPVDRSLYGGPAGAAS